MIVEPHTKIRVARSVPNSGGGVDTVEVEVDVGRLESPTNALAYALALVRGGLRSIVRTDGMRGDDMLTVIDNTLSDEGITLP